MTANSRMWMSQTDPFILTRMRQESKMKIDGHVFHTAERGYGSGLLLLSYEGPGGEVRVPEGVGIICEEAFACCSHVTGVILPEGVLRIEKRAFFKSGIRTVSLPESLVLINEYAFSETPLESVEIPDQVETVGGHAFSDAARLEKAKLPEGINSLEPGVFMGCISLKEVVLPKSLKYIQGGAFANCSALESVSLPEGLEVVWTQAFSGCSALKKMYLGDSVKELGYAAFKDCTALREMRIPEGLKMTNSRAFENDDRLVLTGPGCVKGLIVNEDPDIYYYPGEEKVIVPEGVDELPQSPRLWMQYGIKVLDLPGSLIYYSWYYLSRMESLRQIVTDRGALAAEIPMMLGVECVDRDGERFTFPVPKRSGKWLVEEDAEFGGIRLMGRRGQIGSTGTAEYTTVVLPGEIKGKPVTSVGAGAFEGCSGADAYFIPDSVKRIRSRAFAGSEYTKKLCGELFIRMPENVSIAEDAFEGTKYMTREKALSILKKQEKEAAARAQQKASGQKPGSRAAEAAADDPAIGTGTEGRPGLKPNIWQYFDRLSREERVRELTHSFSVKGGIDGVGWASIKIELDGESAGFRISYIGNSPADFRRFAKGISDGENGSFGWSAEPGAYPWRIQRRGGIFYVDPPVIGKTFFISRVQFLGAAADLTDEWRY